MLFKLKPAWVTVGGTNTSLDLIWYCIKGEKVTFNKKAIFPASQFYIFITCELVDKRPLQYRWRLQRWNKAQADERALSLSQEIPLEMPQPGQEWEAAGLGGWVGGWVREPGGRSCCPTPAAYPSQSLLPPGRAPQGCHPFEGGTAVGQDHHMSCFLYIRSAMLVFKSLALLTGFLIRIGALSELSGDPWFSVQLKLGFDCLFLFKCPLLVNGEDVLLYQLAPR